MQYTYLIHCTSCNLVLETLCLRVCVCPQVLMELACYEPLRKLVCGMFLPQCSPQGGVLQPCWSVCSTAEQQCRQALDLFSLSWPFNCHLLPDSDNPVECSLPWPLEDKLHRGLLMTVGPFGPFGCFIILYYCSKSLWFSICSFMHWAGVGCVDEISQLFLLAGWKTLSKCSPEERRKTPLPTWHMKTHVFSKATVEKDFQRPDLCLFDTFRCLTKDQTCQYKHSGGRLSSFVGNPITSISLGHWPPYLWSWQNCLWTWLSWTTDWPKPLVSQMSVTITQL